MYNIMLYTVCRFIHVFQRILLDFCYIKFDMLLSEFENNLENNKKKKRIYS